MNLSSYTPIFVRADGDDDNDGLTAGTAKATPQAAFDVAMSNLIDVPDEILGGYVFVASSGHLSGYGMAESQILVPDNWANVVVGSWVTAYLWWGGAWHLDDRYEVTSVGDTTGASQVAVGKYVLDIGVGSFGGITLATDWPSRIVLVGAGSGVSLLGGINANGTDEDVHGRNVELTSDLSVDVGGITANGFVKEWNTYQQSGRGGNLTLVEVFSSETISGCGGYNDSWGTDGGDVILHGCVILGDVYANAYAGDAGNVTVVDSQVGLISANGVSSTWYAGNGGNAGQIILTDSSSLNIYANGGTGDGWANGWAGERGSLTLVNSSVGDVWLVMGGGASNPYGGFLTATNSSLGIVIGDGGEGMNGANGTDAVNVTLTDCSCSGGMNLFGGNGMGDWGCGGSGGYVLLNNALPTYINGGSGAGAGGTGAPLRVILSNNSFTGLPAWVYCGTFVGTTNTFTLTPPQVKAALPIQNSTLVVAQTGGHYSDIIGAGLL